MKLVIKNILKSLGIITLFVLVLFTVILAVQLFLMSQVITPIGFFVIVIVLIWIFVYNIIQE
jgi:hypothetical protein